MNRLSCDAVIYGFCRILSGGFCLNGWKLTVGMLETWLRNGGNLSPECWKLQAGIGGNFAPEFAVYDYITNNMDLAASTIAAIYKSRWDIELFFKWIKQNVKVKSFYGRSENAVRIQIWTAAIAFLLMEYIRFLSKTAMSVTEVFRILGSHLMSDRKIAELISSSPRRKRGLIRNLDVQLDFGF